MLAGSSPVLLLRVPQELKDEIHAEASRRDSNANDVILAALADGLGVPAQSNRKGKELMASTNGSKNGRAKDKVRVAIIGVGNCANSLLQGVEYYKDAKPEDTVPGLMHVDLGGYHISDIEFTAAFDVVKGKVGVDLADAIWAHPNDTIKFSDVPKTGVKVSRGMTHDGIGKYMAQVVEKSPGQTDDVVKILKDTGTDVVVNYLPVGSEAATKWYAEQILEAGVAMVNCMPVFIAREPYWQKRFEEAGCPIIGDDIKSQVGATITHRVLTTLFGDRGVHLDRTMQLNVGGNSDFRNMLERERLESKKISKTNAVTSMLDYDIGADNVHVGPSDFVPWLTDRKWAYIRMEGSSFGDVPLNVELKLEVWDSPNSAGIVIDAVRLAKLALNNGIAGSLEAPSAYLMKSPPKQIRDDEAREDIERFIVQERGGEDRRRLRRRDRSPLLADLLDRGGGHARARRPDRHLVAASQRLLRDRLADPPDAPRARRVGGDCRGGAERRRAWPESRRLGRGRRCARHVHPHSRGHLGRLRLRDAREARRDRGVRPRRDVARDHPARPSPRPPHVGRRRHVERGAARLPPLDERALEREQRRHVEDRRVLLDRRAGRLAEPAVAPALQRRRSAGVRRSLARDARRRRARGDAIRQRHRGGARARRAARAAATADGRNRLSCREFHLVTCER